jgi:hypothetical protein
MPQRQPVGGLRCEKLSGLPQQTNAFAHRKIADTHATVIRNLVNLSGFSSKTIDVRFLVS